MLTDRRTPRPADEQPPDGWDETRFWVGTFGVFVTTFVLALVALTFVAALVLGYRPITVVSGSMEPGISGGDVVLYEPHGLSGIEEGTIIVFDDPTVDGGTIIHRVVGTDPDTGWLQTKGDTNSSPDSVWVTEDNIKGVGKIHIPYVGIPAAWIQTGRYAAAFALTAFIVLAAGAARWGWYTRYDPWAKAKMGEGPGDRHLGHAAFIGLLSDGGAQPMAPEQSLIRARKAVLDGVARCELIPSQGAGVLGISRSWFYELRRAYERYGEAGIMPKPRPKGRHPNALSPALRDQIIAYAIEHPTEGPRTIQARLRLAPFGGWSVSHGSVYNVLRDAGLGRVLARLAAAEALSAAEGGPITERALRDIRAQQAAQVTHIGSETPGVEVFFDTMSIGNLKGVGKLWQYSAVDGASSFGVARIIPGDRNGAKGARFLVDDVAPVFEEAGIEIKQATVDGGAEFKKEFRTVCRDLGIDRHQLPPRSPDLNAFVERFQGTCLHLHYRTAFRYRFYESADDVDADLQAWLRFYNFERPRRGYRTRGRPPAAIHYANRSHLLEQERMEPQ